MCAYLFPKFRIPLQYLLRVTNVVFTWLYLTSYLFSHNSWTFLQTKIMNFWSTHILRSHDHSLRLEIRFSVDVLRASVTGCPSSASSRSPFRICHPTVDHRCVNRLLVYDKYECLPSFEMASSVANLGIVPFVNVCWFRRSSPFRSRRSAFRLPFRIKKIVRKWSFA